MSQKSIGEVLQQLMKQSRLSNGLLTAKIEDIWLDTMGKTIAGYTDSIRLQGNTLFITTSVAPLKQELRYQKTLIIQRMNEALGNSIIHELVIQ
jgi:hypothetical protein